jgi:hypothetical protein
MERWQLQLERSGIPELVKRTRGLVLSRNQPSVLIKSGQISLRREDERVGSKDTPVGSAGGGGAGGGGGGGGGDVGGVFFLHRGERVRAENMVMADRSEAAAAREAMDSAAGIGGERARVWDDDDDLDDDDEEEALLGQGAWENDADEDGDVGVRKHDATSRNGAGAGVKRSREHTNAAAPTKSWLNGGSAKLSRKEQALRTLLGDDEDEDEEEEEEDEGKGAKVGVKNEEEVGGGGGGIVGSEVTPAVHSGPVKVQGESGGWEDDDGWEND